jgi:hypothetical protein
VYADPDHPGEAADRGQQEVDEPSVAPWDEGRSRGIELYRDHGSGDRKQSSYLSRRSILSLRRWLAEVYEHSMGFAVQVPVVVRRGGRVDASTKQDNHWGLTGRA